MPIDVPAMPVKPRAPATSAMIKNVMTQLSIGVSGLMVALQPIMTPPATHALWGVGPRPPRERDGRRGLGSPVPSTSPSGLFRRLVRDDLDDLVRGRRRPDVHERALGIGCAVEERALSEPAADPVDARLDHSRFQDEKFVARVRDVGARALAGIERRDMAPKPDEGERRRVDDVDMRPGFGRHRGQAVAVDDRGGKHPRHRLLDGRLVGNGMDAVRADIDDVVRDRLVAQVRQVVRVVRGEENEGPGARGVLLAVDRRHHAALLHEDHLFPWMVVRQRRRRHARPQRRHVDLEPLERRGGIVEDGPCEADRRRPGGERVPVDKRRAERRRMCRRLVGDGDRLGREDRGGCDKRER
jgi:hypothetical protein